MVKNADSFDVNSVSEKNPIGYTLEVELEYLHELHLLHNGYPLAPELIPNLGSKTNYALHCKNLLLYLPLGLKLTKIHRVLNIKLSDWMKKYIDFKTEKKNKYC